MSVRPVLASATILLASALAWEAPSSGQGTPAPLETRWERAVDAWTAGDYPAALEDLRALIRSPQGAAFLERAALLTGELYVTTEVTTDGRNAGISADGRHAAYESGPAHRPVTTVVRLTEDGAEPVMELQGPGVAFDPVGGHLAYLRAPRSDEWFAAQRAVEDAPPTGPERQAALARLDWLLARHGDLVVVDLVTRAERVVSTADLLRLPTSLGWSADGRIVFIGAAPADPARSDVYIVGDAGAPVRLTSADGFKTNVRFDPAGRAVVYQPSATPTFRDPGAPAADPAAGRGRGAAPGGRGGAGAPAGRGGGAGAAWTVVDLTSGSSRTITGSALTMSADGSTLAWLVREGDTSTLFTAPTLADSVREVRTGRERLDAPALSPDGSLVAYQLMSHTDWEIYITDRSGTHARLTRDIQHDVLPRFLTRTTLVAMMGEPRHRRSHLYDLDAGSRVRLFANNTIRTISPEYAWTPSAQGRHLVIQADRDGDTVSTERGVYVVDLTRRVTLADLLARLDRQQAVETELRDRTRRAFEPVADLAREVVARASVGRVYAHEKALSDFDSKHISRPGNLKAIEYLERAYRSFGYPTELQWFESAQAAGGRTANVLATLRGTTYPDLIYVVSSHFDSVAGGPGADDNTSGTAALLEAARILAPSPLPATVVFASFTGEESGLLGSREFVRRTAQTGWKVVGALNNDMIGWASESARMDNTIRYSNPGIRDIQHGAALWFSDLILYDAKYYRGTDAAAFYEAWGDIVGGIGSYPVLANPNYHQPTDFLETMNFRQIAETARVTAATLVYIASSPSRLTGFQVAKTTSGVDLAWTPSPEGDIRHYLVAYGPPADPLRTRLTVTGPRATLPVLPSGTEVAVKAVNTRGLEGWDWARAVLR